MTQITAEELDFFRKTQPNEKLWGVPGDYLGRWGEMEIECLPDEISKRVLREERKEGRDIERQDPDEYRKSLTRSLKYWEWKYRIIVGAEKFLRYSAYLFFAASAASAALVIGYLAFPSLF